jgi:hypothetical protein
METKQAFHEELERYRVWLDETTDPVGQLLLKDIITEMEEIERRGVGLPAIFAQWPPFLEEHRLRLFRSRIQRELMKVSSAWERGAYVRL